MEQYPNRALVKTTKSVFDIEMINADKESKGRKGISFYCGKRHSFTFIQNHRAQTTDYHSLKQPNKKRDDKTAT